MSFNKEQLLSDILEGKIIEENAEEMIRKTDLAFFAPYYAVGVMGVNFKGIIKNSQEIQPHLLSLRKFAIEYLENYMEVLHVICRNKVIVIVRLPKPLEIRDFIYHMNQICKKGSDLISADVTAGIGQPYSGISKICYSYGEAKEAFNYRILLDEASQAIYINDIKPQKGTGMWDEAIRESFKLLRRYQRDLESIFGENFDFYLEMERFSSLEEVERWIKEKCRKNKHAISKEHLDSGSVMIEKAKYYIENHYADSTLSVKQLCKYLNVSTTYFSVMFKKEFGMSFVSYLTKVRLEHAAELLGNTEDKSYIIAEKVGYTEANYFSSVFKKQYGMSPKKYRASLEKTRKQELLEKNVFNLNEVEL